MRKVLWRKLRGFVTAALCLVYIMQINATSFAASVADSKLATGTQQLIQDATSWLMILAPIVAILLIVYFCIRRSAADEMEHKRWNNRITVAIASCVGAVVASATLNLIIGYYR